MPSPSKEAEQIKRIMNGLNCSEAEAKEIYACDREIDRGEKHEFDLPPEKEKIAMKFANATTRKRPTSYQFTARKRKPNPTKEELIAALANYLTNQDEIDVSNVQVTNKTRQVAFSIGEKNFELTLIEKRK